MRCNIFRRVQNTLVLFLLLSVTLAAGTAMAATFITKNGEAVMEAEMFTRRGGTVGVEWTIKTDLPGYNGGGYIESSTVDPTLIFASNIINTQYDIDFRQTGTYYIHLRSRAADHTENGFFATIDGTQIDYGHPDADYIWVEPRGSWYWYSDGGGEGTRGHLLSFDITEPGVKTLAIYRRDTQSKIDRIWITQATSAPQAVASISLPAASTFIVTDDPEICDDNVDNNNNGDTDCDDSQCVAEAVCNPETVCDDGLDDDSDGLTDCEDSDCSSFAGCIPESDCENGIDDDLDGLTDCDDADCAAIDTDNDTVPDCVDVFPNDPDESQDTDTDGTGDNADDDDDNDTVTDTKEYGTNGDVADFDGDADGTPDAKQNTVASLHSAAGADYLTFAITSGQTTFTSMSATEATTTPTEGVLGYDTFNMEMSVSQNGASAAVVLHLPAGETVDAIFLYGPTTDNSEDHWYRFDYDGETGAEINGDKVTLHLVDGQRGDHDLTANSTIVTQIGPTDLDDPTNDDPQPPTGSGGGGGGGCFIQTLR